MNLDSFLQTKFQIVIYISNIPFGLLENFENDILLNKRPKNPRNQREL